MRFRSNKLRRVYRSEPQIIQRIEAYLILGCYRDRTNRTYCVIYAYLETVLGVSNMQIITLTQDIPLGNVPDYLFSKERGHFYQNFLCCIWLSRNGLGGLTHSHIFI